MSRKLRGNLLLLLTALIWGSSFVAQRAGMEYIGPFTFNGIRMFIGGIVLIPAILFLQKGKKRQTAALTEAEKVYTNEITAGEKAKQRNMLLAGGISCGVVLFVASSLQQVGLLYTTAGKAGFITALYIVLVPILGLFLRKKVRPLVWLCVLFGAAGLYLLCIKEGFSIGRGDFLVILCAVFYALHILVIDYFSPRTDGVKMSCLQFFVCGVISLFPMLIAETPKLHDILISWPPLLYAGILSCGVGYTFQIIAQRDTDPTVASLLLSMESVFAVIAGVLILHEVLTMRELLGCALMFAAIIFAQLPEKSGIKTPENTNSNEEESQ